MILWQAGNGGRDLLRHAPVDAGDFAVGIGRHDGDAGVGLLPDWQRQRQGAQIGQSMRLCQLFAAVDAKYMLAVSALAAAGLRSPASGFEPIHFSRVRCSV